MPAGVRGVSGTQHCPWKASFLATLVSSLMQVQSSLSKEIPSREHLCMKMSPNAFSCVCASSNKLLMELLEMQALSH